MRIASKAYSTGLPPGSGVPIGSSVTASAVVDTVVLFGITAVDIGLVTSVFVVASVTVTEVSGIDVFLSLLSDNRQILTQWVE